MASNRTGRLHSFDCGHLELARGLPSRFRHDSTSYQEFLSLDSRLSFGDNSKLAQSDPGALHLTCIYNLELN
jgi:hypothetical protein